MRHSLVTVDYKSLPFAQRLALVRAAIRERVSRVSVEQQAALRARLWCLWLNREVLA